MRAATASVPTDPAKGDRLSIVGMLWARYRDAFSQAWAMRHELAGPRREAAEIAFLPAALSLQETPTHPAPRRLAWLLILAFTLAVVWAFVGKVDIVAVAKGRIILSDRTKLIQPFERSVIRRVLVTEGSRVTEEQALVELDATAAVADRASAQEMVLASQLEIAKASLILKALPEREMGALTVLDLSTTGLPAADALRTQEWRRSAKAEWADIRAKLHKSDVERTKRSAEIATARQHLAKLEMTLPLLVKRETEIASLARGGWIAGHVSQDRAKERLEAERDIVTQQSRITEAQAALAETQATREAYVAETRRGLHDRLTSAEQRRQQALQDQAKATQREAMTVLRSPVAGTVQQLAVHTVGGVATEAQVLMVIVPLNAEVTAEVTIENKDIGFVKAGQATAVKLDAFPYTRYGAVEATVTQVSADSMRARDTSQPNAPPQAEDTNGFAAYLRLNASAIQVEGHPRMLTPGMSLVAEVKTGKRRIIEYLLSPIQRATSESLRER